MDDSLIELVKRPYRLYFAYASNMHPDQFHTRVGKGEVVAVAALENHRLEFFDHTKLWDSGMEALVVEKGHTVWGLVYKLPFSSADTLDSIYDVRLDGTGPYFHFPARVKALDGQVHTVLLYKKDYSGKPVLPSTEFLNFIVEGAQKRGLPPSYVEELKRLPSKPAAYPVPKSNKYEALLRQASGCPDCTDLRVSKGGPGLGA